ncbi:MAG: malto-oligosyltrehalose synthase, partial [Acidobacteria bacterium]|nr:malto-oligosyltrehalose synthase [Acidobacteriota bacterium]
PADRAVLERALAEARRRLTAEDVSDAAFSFLRRVLLMEPVYGLPGVRRARLQFVMRWQQFTGAAMAKGLEDTTFYVYNRLVSLNEVGGEPDSAPGGVAAFHQFCARRLERHPGALNATSTHDTKRSEDVRARIHLLAEIPAEWEAAVLRWSELNAPRRRVVRGQRVPGPNHEYLLYQNLVGAWPLDERERPALRERFRDYMLKAAREAQVRTSWIRPDEDHEQALSGFVDEILDPALSAAFLADFAGFHARIAYAGALNSLAQVALKVAAPGVPDVYQGTEMWDFSLVDPDNRRPVDYDARRQALASVDEPGAARSLAEALHRGWRDGRLKLYVLARALRHRREHAELFARGTYAPLPASGPHARHVCAFARRLGEDWLLCAVPRLPLRLGLGSVPAPWAEDALALPDGAPAAWRDLFTGASVRARNDVLPLAEVFATLPLALLVPDAGAD